VDPNKISIIVSENINKKIKSGKVAEQSHFVNIKKFFFISSSRPLAYNPEIIGIYIIINALNGKEINLAKGLAELYKPTSTELLKLPNSNVSVQVITIASTAVPKRGSEKNSNSLVAGIVIDFTENISNESILLMEYNMRRARETITERRYT